MIPSDISRGVLVVFFGLIITATFTASLSSIELSLKICFGVRRDGASSVYLESHGEN